MCRIDGRLGSYDASCSRVIVEIPFFKFLISNQGLLAVDLGHCMVGSLTGAVASQRVTEARNGKLRLVGNQF